MENKFDDELNENTNIEELFKDIDEKNISNNTNVNINNLDIIKNALAVIEPIIGKTSYQCWINSGIIDVDIIDNKINIICINAFTACIIKERYSNYIEEIITSLYNEVRKISYIS